MKTKICSKCGIEKPLIEFHERKMSKDGYSGQCSKCKNIYNKIYRQNNRDKIIFNNRKWRNSKKGKKTERNYRIENRELLLQKSLNYQKKNKLNINEYKKNWAKNNKNSRHNSNNKYRNKRYKEDKIYKIIVLIRNRIKFAIKRQETSKKYKTIKLLGCDFDFYMKYMKKLFKTGMTWENHGKWHIDHIKPLSSFDLTKPEEQKKAFHYSNTQPLWAEDNLRKSNKIYV